MLEPLKQQSYENEYFIGHNSLHLSQSKYDSLALTDQNNIFNNTEEYKPKNSSTNSNYQPKHVSQQIYLHQEYDSVQKNSMSFVLRQNQGTEDSKDTFLQELKPNDYGYDPAMIPSDISLAESHQKANMIGTPLNHQKICPCCFKPVFKERPKFRNDFTLNKYGSGLPVYFYILKTEIILISLLFFLNSLYHWVKLQEICPQNMEEQNIVCYKILFFYMMNPNITTDLSNIDSQITDYLEKKSILNFATIIFLIIFGVIREKYLFNKYQQFDFQKDKISRYTLLVENLPLNLGSKLLNKIIQKELNKHFQQKFGNIKIFQTSRIFKVGKLYQILLNIKTLKTQIQTEQFLMKNLKFSKDSPNRKKRLLLTKSTIINQNEQKLFKNQKIFEETLKKIEFSGSAFIIFKDKETPKLIQDYFKMTPFQQFLYKKNLIKNEKSILINKKRLQFSFAPEPNDIIWENQGVQLIKKYISRFLEFFLHILFLSISNSIFLGLYFLQNLEKENQPDLSFYSVEELLTNIGIAILVMFIIFVGKIIIKILSDYRCYSTHSQRNKEVLQKLLFFNLTCSIVVPFVFALYIERKNLSSWLPTLFFLNIFSCFSHLQYRILNPQIIFSFLYKFYIKKFRKNQQIHQEKLNQIFENPKTNIADILSNINKITLFAIVYSCSIPIIPLICILSIIITYFFDRYLILYKWSEPYYISDSLFKQNTINNQWIILCFIILNTLDYLIHIFTKQPFFQSNIYQIFTLLSYGVTVLYFALNFMTDFNSIFFHENQDQYKSVQFQEENFNEFNFEHSYDRCNPISYQNSNAKYIKHRVQAEQDTSNEVGKLDDSNAYENEINNIIKTLIKEDDVIQEDIQEYDNDNENFQHEILIRRTLSQQKNNEQKI